jgi:hypothetical protein
MKERAVRAQGAWLFVSTLDDETGVSSIRFKMFHGESDAFRSSQHDPSTRAVGSIAPPFCAGGDGTISCRRVGCNIAERERGVSRFSVECCIDRV